MILLVTAPYTIAWNRSGTSGALLSAIGIALALLCVRQAEVQRAHMHGDGGPS